MAMKPVFKNGKPLFLPSGKPAFAEDPCACCEGGFGSCDECREAVRGTTPTVAGLGLTLSGFIDSECVFGDCPPGGQEPGVEYFYSILNDSFALTTFNANFLWEINLGTRNDCMDRGLLVSLQRSVGGVLDCVVTRLTYVHKMVASFNCIDTDPPTVSFGLTIHEQSFSVSGSCFQICDTEPGGGCSGGPENIVATGDWEPVCNAGGSATGSNPDGGPTCGAIPSTETTAIFTILP